MLGYEEMLRYVCVMRSMLYRDLTQQVKYGVFVTAV